jgi:hypothetical protein
VLLASDDRDRDNGGNGDQSARCPMTGPWQLEVVLFAEDFVGLPAEQGIVRLSSRFGGDLSVRERDLDAGAAQVDRRDQRVGGVESVCAV